jgi:hypothetical protein
MLAGMAAALQIVLVMSVLQYGLVPVNAWLARIGKRFPSWLYSAVVALLALYVLVNPLDGVPRMMLGEIEVSAPREAVSLVTGFVPLALVHALVPHAIDRLRGTFLLYPSRRRLARERTLTIVGLCLAAGLMALLAHRLVILAG